MSTLSRLPLFSSLFFSACCLPAQMTYFFKPGPQEGKDAQVASLVPYTNNGTTTVLAGYAWTQGGMLNRTRGLLAFDLSSIPQGSTVLSASLSLYRNPTFWIGQHSGDNGLMIQRVTSPWSESGVTWSDQPGVSSMNTVSLPPSTSVLQDYTGIDVTALVQDMLNDPANSHGFRIKLQNEAAYRVALLSSSDHEDPTRWPELKVSVIPNYAAVAPKVFLGGAYAVATGLMSDGLRSQGLLSLVEPYSGAGYVLVNNTTPSTTGAVLSVTGNNAIVDWVLVEARASTSPFDVLRSRTALLQRDGDVVAPDGVSPVTFDLPAGSYHVALRHRNHFGVMTAAPLTLSSIAPPLLDLTTTAAGTYGTDARQILGAVAVLWAGDADGNGVLKYTGLNNDRDAILTAIGGNTPNAVLTNVYDRRDVNMDGVIKYAGSGNDRDVILTFVGGTTPNNVRLQQLP